MGIVSGDKKDLIFKKPIRIIQKSLLVDASGKEAQSIRIRATHLVDYALWIRSFLFSKINLLKLKMNRLKENWFKVVIILVLVLAFFWYEYRPSHIHKNCYKETKQRYEDKETIKPDNFDFSYKYCLRRKGLK